MADVFTASAAEARKKAREYRRVAEYARCKQSGHDAGATSETRYRWFCVAAVLAFELRAEAEERIAAMYEAGAEHIRKTGGADG